MGESMFDLRKAKETQEAKDLVFRCLSYNPETGEFVWKVSARNKVSAGRIAGTLHKSGYRTIKIKRVTYQCSRLAWLFGTGAWPSSHIDHINNNKIDNRFSNLREATHSQNGCNRPMAPYNTSGFKGVSWASKENKYKAQITFQGKDYSLGMFDDPAEAHEAYKAAALRLHGEFARTEACLDATTALNGVGK